MEYASSGGVDFVAVTHNTHIHHHTRYGSLPNRWLVGVVGEEVVCVCVCVAAVAVVNDYLIHVW
jgi:hypothetical protein